MAQPTLTAAQIDETKQKITAGSASGQPAERLSTLALQIWIVFFLLMLMAALTNYLINWLT